MSIWGVLLFIVLGAVFLFTLKNFVQFQFKESKSANKMRSLNNAIWGIIVFVSLFLITMQFAEELGIEVSCNSYQLKYHPEQCENQNE
ncbi:MAG: hypothetical protein COB03_19245 [Alteromonas sp.]|nr:MAG: hypothetical protein COB03_19245 [Alteromonas sp.]